jgi:hypothetical protein
MTLDNNEGVIETKTWPKNVRFDVTNKFFGGNIGRQLTERDDL